MKFFSIAFAAMAALTPLCSVALGSELAPKPPITLFSQLKQLKSQFSGKSQFETLEAYATRIKAMRTEAGATTLRVFPESAKYNAENQELELVFKTEFAILSTNLPEADKKIATALGLNFGPYENLLSYRVDKVFGADEPVTCENVFGVRFNFIHAKVFSSNYLLNLVNNRNIQKVSIQLPPEQARQYFSADEVSLNGRLILGLSINPVAPFYSSYTSTFGGLCPKSWNMVSRNRTFTWYNANHIIHARLEKIEVIDWVSGQSLTSSDGLPPRTIP